MAAKAYDHQEIEKKAQEKWVELGGYVTDLDDTTKEPYYLLFEFPYPSGDLHIGHWYAFALTDIFARFKRMQGKNVLFPMGFDAFGLPAENAAMKNGADPKEWTYANMDRMRSQIKSMGTSVDWSKEVVTCDPDYYRWTQWLFEKLFEQKLAYRAEASVKWCPKDKTVLANEQVIDGRCERCGTAVEEKRLTQWFLKITEYADRLLSDLEPLPWRKEIKDAQRSWIGKSEGAKIPFLLDFKKNPSDNERRGPDGERAHLTVFTTRPDTIYGVTYIVIAPEHLWVKLATDDEHDVLENKDEVRAYVEQSKRKTDRERSENKEKTGIQIKGVMAINPATKEEIPIYVADYVIGSYGTGVVMAVPAHDERDFEFAQKFGIPVKQVIAIPAGAEFKQVAAGTGVGNWVGHPIVFQVTVGPDRQIIGWKFENIGQECHTCPGALINSGVFDGRNSEEAMGDIMAAIGGEKATQYRLRDWLVSRQRYWGCPIPVVYDPEGNTHLVPAEHLPWLLPTDVDFSKNDSSPLSTSMELRERVERIFGKGWTPEYDTLDTFVDSSWYYLRYLDPKDENAFSNQSRLRRWLPVNRYSGGSEHTTMHLLYARFFHKALFDLALVPTAEPFFERFNRGLVLGTDGQKMSKRWGNVVNPDEMVAAYGADAVRIFLAFMGPYNEPGSYPWSLEGVTSMRRFLDRIVYLSEKVGDTPMSEIIERAVAQAITKVESDTERFKFNTAISAIMVLLRTLEGEGTVPRDAFLNLLKLLAPFAPHLAEHLWEASKGGGSVHFTSWPSVDESLLAESVLEVTVQVNGKRRGSISLAPDASETEAIQGAMAISAVATALGGKEPSRVVYVPGKILNLVLA